MTPALALLLMLAVAAPPSPPAAERPAPPRSLRDSLLAETQKHFDARRQTIAQLKSPAEVAQRQKLLRQRFIDALGGFPERTPLRPRIVGTLRCDGYSIDKVIYESRPNHHVTANFYLPEGKGPFPGVLMPIGHSVNGKAAEYIQRGAILLARHGFAVLTYDPIGQGERRQILEAGKPFFPGSTTEHTMIGVGALLVGSNTASYRIWDGIRSLDYLAGRPEVDPKRLGCTGCSGGGTLTSYLMALDDRIFAAAPSCYITSLERLFATIGPQDAEQNITAQVALGLEHADYITLHAPRPTLICAATRDFFDIQGTWVSFREAKRIFGLLGHPERVDIVETDTTHGFPRAQREAVLRFMRRWLQNRTEPVVEEDFPIRPDAELLCTRTGQVLEDLKGVSAFQLSARRASELAESRAKNPPGDDFDDRLCRLLGIARAVPPARKITEGNGSTPLRELLFETEPGILLPARLSTPPDARPNDPLLVVVRDEGCDLPPTTWQVKGRRVLLVELRGLRGVPPTKSKPGPFGSDFRETYLALHLGRPLLGQRTHDLLAILAALSRDNPRGFELIAHGKAGLIALHAAALSPLVQRLTLESVLSSWTAVATQPISQDQLSSVVPAALTLYDLPELAARFAPRPLTIRNGTDARARPLSRKDLEHAYTTTQSAYTRRSAAAAFRLETPE